MEKPVSFVCGLVFGIGLIISGMSDPAKVLGFLDLAGAWDPSLALVMAGAIGVAVLPFSLVRAWGTSWRGQPVRFPPAPAVDRDLLLGSALFGIGWGLAGFCPGPALVGLAVAYRPAFVFVLAMLAGMKLFEHFRPDGGRSID